MSQEEPPVPVYSKAPEPEGRPVAMKETLFRARDEIFSGKTVRGVSTPTTRDQSLLHTSLTKKSHVKPAHEKVPADNETGKGSDGTAKQEKKTGKPDDISWI